MQAKPPEKLPSRSTARPIQSIGYCSAITVNKTRKGRMRRGGVRDRAAPLGRRGSDLTSNASINLNQRIALISNARRIAYASFSLRFFVTSHYQAYALDDAGCPSAPAYHLVCDSDDEAIERARRLVGSRRFELRSADRSVLRFEARRVRSTIPTHGASE